MKKVKKINKNLIKSIEKRFEYHHELYSQSVKAELWEEILVQSIQENGNTANWEAGCHKIGEDISTDMDFGRISCKSGSLSVNKKGQEMINISGSRTTKHKTLESKINHLSKSHDDYYFCLAKYKKDIDSDKYRYYLIIFPSTLIKPSNLKWKKNGNDYVAEGVGITQRISTSMSGQLWTSFDTSMALFRIELNAGRKN
jgi:hypothetical protein